MKLAEAKKWGMIFYLFGGLAICRVASNNNIQKPTFNRQCLVIFFDVSPVPLWNLLKMKGSTNHMPSGFSSMFQDVAPHCMNRLSHMMGYVGFGKHETHQQTKHWCIENL